MRTSILSALLILANFAIALPSAGPQPGVQAEGKFVIAQRFCPNGRC